MCRECNSARVKKWQADNPERHIENWKRHTANKDSVVAKARQYNISYDDLTGLFDAAAGVCQICNQEGDRWLVIDHCHQSMRIRGILCEKCNQALGLFRDSVGNLERAIEYLEKEPLEYSEYESVGRRKLK